MKKRNLITIIVAALVVIATSITVITITATNNKSCKIAFYGLSELVQNSIKESITTSFPEDDIEYTVLDVNTPLSDKTAKKYNLIFTYNGRNVYNISDDLTTFPKEVYNLMPSNIGNASLIDDKNLVLPILLDHYEIAYYRTYREQCQLGIPQIEDHLQLYLEMIKDKAIFPLYLAGAVDEDLLGFVSLLAESSMSPDSYKTLLDDIYTAVKLDNPLPVELKDVLDKTKDMVNNQFLYRKWYENTKADLDFAMKEHKVGAIVTSLSKHREMPFVIIKYYDSFMYPKASPDSTSLVAPLICAVMPKDKANAKAIAESLVHTEAQTYLSDATKLAPVSSRAQSHDMQADDVRFMAASTSGPVPSIIEGSCTCTEDVAKLASKIREYLSK